ncbi:YidC/Oxa1 family membrane protein insertase [Heliorestis acidaminivorans]|uniref:YidC/Oxa1 family membrane protein insertase n=1 Tax=Heliorestis acidaminivorans TaxID=553427 RepID=UPI001FA96C59|nr:YidC/Oxa1 family membrane protein insertase [Heliorestis acidaminivorans]
MGLWDLIVGSFSSLIQFFYNITSMVGLANYGLAIILITVFIKMALYPLTVKQMRSMRSMAELAPKQKAIQEKHKKNPQKAQEEMMKLYKDSGVNPLSGCLPLLIQLPILIAFYGALLNFNYANPAHSGFLWVPSLSVSDPYILPLLAAATTYLQMKVSAPPKNLQTPQSEQMQKMMSVMMPLLIGWMAHTFPAGLALYWVTFNTVGILQQLYINRSFEVQKGEGTA